MSNPITPEINPHLWARGTEHEIAGAVIRIGKRDMFIGQPELPAAIARLQAIHALNA